MNLNKHKILLSSKWLSWYNSKLFQDEAINSNVIMLYPESNDLVDSVRGMLSAHVVDGFYTSGDLEDEQILETIGGTTATTIRINRYQAPKKVMHF